MQAMKFNFNVGEMISKYVKENTNLNKVKAPSQTSHWQKNNVVSKFVNIQVVSMNVNLMGQKTILLSNNVFKYDIIHLCIVF